MGWDAARCGGRSRSDCEDLLCHAWLRGARVSVLASAAGLVWTCSGGVRLCYVVLCAGQQASKGPAARFLPGWFQAGLGQRKARNPPDSEKGGTSGGLEDKTAGCGTYSSQWSACSLACSLEGRSTCGRQEGRTNSRQNGKTATDLALTGGSDTYLGMQEEPGSSPPAGTEGRRAITGVRVVAAISLIVM